MRKRGRVWIGGRPTLYLHTAPTHTLRTQPPLQSSGAAHPRARHRRDCPVDGQTPWPQETAPLFTVCILYISSKMQAELKFLLYSFLKWSLTRFFPFDTRLDWSPLPRDMPEVGAALKVFQKEMSQQKMIRRQQQEVARRKVRRRSSGFTLIAAVVNPPTPIFNRRPRRRHA